MSSKDASVKSDSSKNSASNNNRAQISQDNDIVDLIITDHITVKEAFQKLKTGGSKGKDQSGTDGGKGKDKGSAGDAAGGNLESVYQKMCWDIAEHAVAEELVFYPFLEKGLGEEGKKITAESRADHEKTKQAMSEVDGKPFEEVQAQVIQMVEELIEHMDKEEGEDLVVSREKFDKKQLFEVAQQFTKAKMFAPKTGKPTDGKQPFESPYALMMAPTDDIKKMFESALPTEGQNDDQEESGAKRYNLRNHGGETDGKNHQNDDQKNGQKTSPSAGDKQQGRRSGERDSGKGGKNVTSPAKNGSHEKNGGHKNGSPGNDAGDDAIPPAKRGADSDEHARKKGSAADRGEEEVAANE